MRPISVVQQGVGISDWKIVNWHAIDVQIGIGCTILQGTGSATYTVEYCYEDVNALADEFGNQLSTGALAQFPTVFALPALTNQTANADAQNAFTGPVGYIRLNVTDGTGTVVMTYIQSGIGG